jgi:putative transposase
MYSKKKVSNVLSDSTELNGYVRALNRANYQTNNIKGLIYYSGRGIQYFSNLYTQIFKRKKIGIDITEENH